MFYAVQSRYIHVSNLCWYAPMYSIKYDPDISSGTCT